jgi:hypothetical protein
MSTTTLSDPGRPGTPRWALPVAIAALFVLMATLLLTAVLIPLLAPPEPGLIPRPQPAPAPVQPR